MAILNNLDNDKPLFESESSSLAIKVFSETCCNGCSCKSESDHKPEMRPQRQVLQTETSLEMPQMMPPVKQLRGLKNQNK